MPIKLLTNLPAQSSTESIESNSIQTMDSESTSKSTDEISKLSPELPVDLISKILDKIDVSDLVNCRLVNRRWRDAVDAFRIKNLAILKYFQKQFKNERSYPTNRLIKDHYHRLSQRTTNFFQNSIVRTMLSELKELYLEDGSTNYSTFDLENLNQLKSLENLQIVYLNTIKGKKLDLPMLRTLLIKSYSKLNGLLIGCERLQNFKTDCTLNHFIFLYPESIKRLDIDSCKYFKQKMKMFENLEKLILRRSSFMPDDLIKLLPHLVELRIKMIEKDEMMDLMKKKRTLRRIKLRIFLSGIHIESNGEIDDYCQEDALMVKKTQLLADKFKRLTDFEPWIECLNFSVLNNHFKGKLPIELIERFINLNHLIISKPLDKTEQLSTILINYSEKLTRLDFNTSIEQTIYDQLDKWTNKLNVLKIIDKQPVKMEFIFKQKFLQQLITNQQLDIDFLIQIPFHLQALTNISFKFNKKDAEISNNYYERKLKIDSNVACFSYSFCVYSFLREFKKKDDLEQF